MARDLSWQEKAECKKAPNFVDWSEAAQKVYCRGCPVSNQCLEYALSHESGQHYEIEHPVYGGLTGKERRTLSRRKARKVAA